MSRDAALLGANYADFIDAHETVFRFAGSARPGYEKYVGRKTDVTYLEYDCQSAPDPQEVPTELEPEKLWLLEDKGRSPRTRQSFDCAREQRLFTPPAAVPKPPPPAVTAVTAAASAAAAAAAQSTDGHEDPFVANSRARGKNSAPWAARAAGGGQQARPQGGVALPVVAVLPQPPGPKNPLIWSRRRRNLLKKARGRKQQPGTRQYIDSRVPCDPRVRSHEHREHTSDGMFCQRALRPLFLPLLTSCFPWPFLRPVSVCNAGPRVRGIRRGRAAGQLARKGAPHAQEEEKTRADAGAGRTEAAAAGAPTGAPPRGATACCALCRAPAELFPALFFFLPRSASLPSLQFVASLSSSAFLCLLQTGPVSLGPNCDLIFEQSLMKQPYCQCGTGPTPLSTPSHHTNPPRSEPAPAHRPTSALLQRACPFGPALHSCVMQA